LTDRTLCGCVDRRRAEEETATYGHNLGEEDGKERLDGSVDGGADQAHQDVGPLGQVETQHLEE